MTTNNIQLCYNNGYEKFNLTPCIRCGILLATPSDCMKSGHTIVSKTYDSCECGLVKINKEDLLSKLPDPKTGFKNLPKLEQNYILERLINFN